MSSDIKTTGEDADMAECDGEKVVTMMDVLQEQEDFEEDANAVLGASDEKNCTYSKGYIKRQAIYACMTCCPEAKSDPTKRAGVCLACSLMCHENHELVELYTKRNFRCDCGNPKFNSHPCTFTPNKTDLNEDNYYNQNFSGLYCTCQRPYPDPESTEEDEMIQCIMCEDWLHASHLEATVPTNDQYSEMICKICMENNDFLHDYSDLAVNMENINVDIINVNGVDANNTKLCNGNAKAEAIDSTLNDNVSEGDVEMREEKLKVSVNTKNTIIEIESTEGNPSSFGIENKSIIEEVTLLKENKEISIEINQSEQAQTSNATSEEQAANISQKPSIDNKEEKETSETISTTDKIPKDIPDELAVNKTENIYNKSTEENVPDQSGNCLKDDSEKSKNETEQKTNELSDEKMEEDSLLADPVCDTQKTDSVENSIVSKEKNIINNETVLNENEEPKPESDVNSDNGEKSNTSDGKVDLEEISNKSTQNETNINFENPSTNNDSSNKKTIESESVTEENKNLIEPTCHKESTIEDESSSSKKSSEKRKHGEEDSDKIEVKKLKLDDKVCVRPKGVKKVYKGATFWPSNFRQQICTCQECISMYKDLSVLFLMDPDDTITAYENLGKEKINGEQATQYEKGLQALSSLDRIQQINALTEYNKMRDKLLDFLKSFKDRKEIVKEEDIKAFFAGMRPKREPDGVYFCR